MKNKISDLNNILFEQLERLNDEELKGENLTNEINRTKSITEVAKQVTDNYKVQLDAVRMLADGGYLQPDDAKVVLGLTNGSN
jgi:hypothetical protein